MTTGPRTQSSPRCPGPSTSPVEGSTIFASKCDASFPTEPYALHSSGPTVEATEPDVSVRPSNGICDARGAPPMPMKRREERSQRRASSDLIMATSTGGVAGSSVTRYRSMARSAAMKLNRSAESITTGSEAVRRMVHQVGAGGHRSPLASR
ncbi:hypothetical protein Zm00014a_001806 [Zea mays]|uniref:Uncharacterized protein n=1 Tax=Zea mays TaxID=4577 RepID=A0A3L6E2Y0_MAIZE|nr:hypothetical protein Zm00014a_001806 [Zea mays]